MSPASRRWKAERARRRRRSAWNGAEQLAQARDPAQVVRAISKGAFPTQNLTSIPCRDCGKPIVLLRSRRGKWMPLEPKQGGDFTPLFGAGLRAVYTPRSMGTLAFHNCTRSVEPEPTLPQP